MFALSRSQWWVPPRLPDFETQELTSRATLAFPRSVALEVLSQTITLASADGRAMRLSVVHDCVRFGSVRGCDVGHTESQYEMASRYAQALEQQLADNLASVSAQALLPHSWVSRRTLEPYSSAGALVSVRDTLREEMGSAPTLQAHLCTFDTRTGQQVTLASLFGAQACDSVFAEVEARLGHERPHVSAADVFGVVNRQFAVVAETDGRFTIDVVFVPEQDDTTGVASARWNFEIPGSQSHFRVQVGL
jgi:hypothetical protein